MARKWTDEEKKAFAEKMKAARAMKEVEKENVVIQSDQDVDELKRQIAELRDIINQNMQPAQAAPTMNMKGQLIGEWEKYIVDPAHYPDPTGRLAEEPRLAPLAFKYNYELTYQVGVSSYQTKDGRNVKEPKFTIKLDRIVLDDQGNQTLKRYVVKQLIFHEDPDAALVIARENGVEVDKTNEKRFLDEMRYLRVRDWLLDIFFPKPISQQESPVHDEVIGGSVVSVFTKSSVEPSEIDFSQIQRKL